MPSTRSRSKATSRAASRTSLWISAGKTLSWATALQLDVNPELVLRAGFNYSSSPITGDTVDNNIAFAAIVKKRASGGFTYRLGRNREMTVAYLKAFREELASTTGSGTKISLSESAADFELSYRF